MRIVFVLGAGGASFSGGFRIVAGYADRLAARGHTVTIIAPGGSAPGGFWAKIKSAAMGARGARQPSPPPFVRNPDVRITIKHGVDSLSPEDFPPADVLIATWWETAEWIAQAGDDVSKIHFVQDHEVFPYLPVERARAVHRLEFPKIVVSQWLYEVMQREYGAAAHVVQNAIQFDEFSRGEREKPNAPTIGFVYSVAARKNAALAIEACRRLKLAIPDLAVVSFGSHKARSEDKMPSWISHHVKPTADEIAAIYNSCTGWLFTSDEEGFGLPILEAMAAGAPVIATPAGAAPQLVNASNGVIVDRAAEAIVKGALQILNLSPADWAVLSRGAQATARKRNWDQATNEFDSVLMSIVQRDRRQAF